MTTEIAALPEGGTFADIRTRLAWFHWHGEEGNVFGAWEHILYDDVERLVALFDQVAHRAAEMEQAWRMYEQGVRSGDINQLHALYVTLLTRQSEMRALLAQLVSGELYTAVCAYRALAGE